MNWQAISFDWNQVRAFLAAAEEGSFSGAARALRTTQPTIGRQISDLEATLGVTLFERSVRGPSLTDVGHDLLEHVRAMADAATLISLSASGHATEVSGEVTVTATDLMSATMLPGLLAPLRTEAPGIRVNIVAVNDVQNLLKREADIAIRHVRPSQPELIARHVGDFRANLYGATTYLDRVGRPRTPREVANLTFVGPPEREGLIGVMQNHGISVRPENFTMLSESGVVIWELLKAGFGVSMLPEPLCEDEPGIEKVLSDLPSLEFPIWLVTHRELQTSQRIRTVFDLLARSLASLAGKSAPRTD